MVVVFGWKGNRRSGVASVMHHSLCDIFNRLRMEVEHPTYTPPWI